MLNMRFLILFSVLCFLGTLTSCDKLPKDCDRFENWKIISEDDKEDVCNFQQIYLLDGEYYTICECCTCDKNPLAIDCNGEVYCDFSDGCLVEFYQNAEYQFSAIEE